MGWTREIEEPARVPRQPVDLLRLVGVRLAIAIGASALAVALQQRVIQPPELDARLGSFHVMAFTTYDPACANYLLCPPDHIAASAPEYYAIWVLPPPKQPCSRNTSKRVSHVFVLPLHR